MTDPLYCINPYKKTCEGAKLLAKRSGWPMVWEDVNPSVPVINWGAGFGVFGSKRKVFNKSSAIEHAIDKLTAYGLFKQAGVKRMLWTSAKSDAQRWLDNGDVVYARNLSEGMDGAGIKVYEPGSKIVGSHLFYTQGFPTQREYRLNVAFGRVIDIVEKRPDLDTDYNPRLRTGDAWLYCKSGIVPPSTATKAQAVLAVGSLGLDFGGVDIAESEDGRTCVFEVNTAPWLGIGTADAYIKAFRAQAS